MTGLEYYKKIIKTPGLLNFLNKKHVLEEYKLSCINCYNVDYEYSIDYGHPEYAITNSFTWSESNEFLLKNGYNKVYWGALHDDFRTNYKKYINTCTFKNIKLI